MNTDHCASNNIFITGGTGYIGKELIRVLLKKGYKVRALVRPGSGHKLPPGALAVMGDALDPRSFVEQIAPAETLIHLVGTRRPNPLKARSFRNVDLVSIQATVSAAIEADIKHLIYLSVAQPAPVMRAYIAARKAGETLIGGSGIPATILRPWYVLGPGHRWPYVLIPFYKLLERIPAMREPAQRLGLATLQQMVNALIHAVENPPRKGARIIEAPEIGSMTTEQ